jgi:hypothetical protein
MAAMRLTTARYYPPSGRNIHREKDAKPEETWGVMPDAGCEVKLNDEAFRSLSSEFAKGPIRLRMACQPMRRKRQRMMQARIKKFQTQACPTTLNCKKPFKCFRKN